MGADTPSIYNVILEELDAHRPVGESMTRLIDVCEQATPHADWALFRKLPYDDLKGMLDWIGRPFRDDPPKWPLKGLWFGLFNPVDVNRKTVADLYVCGSKRFNPSPDSNAWAVSPEWWPKSRYSNSTVLAEVYRVAYRMHGLKTMPSIRCAWGMRRLLFASC